MAGPTLTLWIPGIQQLILSSLVQSLPVSMAHSNQWSVHSPPQHSLKRETLCSPGETNLGRSIQIFQESMLHDFLVVITDDGEVVMKVHEHCFDGAWKNSPLKVVNTDVAGTPLNTYRETHCHSLSAEKMANMVTMYDRFISPDCRPEYLPPLNCHTTDPCPPTTVTPTALSSSSGRPRKQSKCSVQGCDGTGHRNPDRWSEGHTTRAGCPKLHPSV